LKERYKVGDNEYKLSVAGTRRYMAPEVWLKTPYGKPADVYSFALTMWEILSLEKPYATSTVLDLNQKVCRKKKRPPTLKDLDKSLNQLMGLSWSHDPKERLTMNDIQGRLESSILNKGVQM
jgi:serine/threonine protein kinase